MNIKESNNKSMSFWGIGPVFGILSVTVSGIAAYFTFNYPEIYRFECCQVLIYILGGIITLFGLYLWIGEGGKIDNYIKNNILAKKGGYGIVRNPIYSGILFVMTGVFLCLQSWLLLASIPFNYFILILLLNREDSVLIKTFGEEYLQYKKQVNSIIPKLKSFYSAFFYPEETKKITENLYVLKSKDANIFIYKTTNQYLCFDTGYGKPEMLDEFKKLDISPDYISNIFLTHTDYDHTRGIHLFKNAKLFLGKNEEPLINGTKSRFVFLYSNPKIKRVYTLLDNQQIILIDNTEIKTIYTPGHTIGHVSYLINNRILITGDAVVWQNGFIKPFYSFFNMNHHQAKETAKKLAEYKGQYIICTAHTGVIQTK